MANITGLILEVARDSRSPRTYRATVDYDVSFEPSERRDRAAFGTPFCLATATTVQTATTCSALLVERSVRTARRSIAA